MAIKRSLEIQLKRLHNASAAGDYSRFHEIDNELHHELVAACGLPALLRSWEVVVADIDSWILHVQQAYWPSLMSLYREHVLLLEAWNSHYDWVAEEATHQHLEAGWYRLAATQGDMRPEIDPVDRTASFLSTHFASQLDIPWIARHVSFVSASHLTRLFRKKLGISPKAFLKQVRMECAAELLRSSPDRIASLAPRVGYKNVSHFVRDFHKFFGSTPSAYRRASQKGSPRS